MEFLVLTIAAFTFLLAAMSVNLVRLARGRERLGRRIEWRVAEVALVVLLPLTVVDFSAPEGYEDRGALTRACCLPTTFAVEHVWSLFVWVLLMGLAVMIGSGRRPRLPPLVEVLIDCTLLIGVVINAAVAYHLVAGSPAPREITEEDYARALCGNLSIALVLWCNLIDAYYRGQSWAIARGDTRGISARGGHDDGAWTTATPVSFGARVLGLGAALLGPRRVAWLVLACAPFFALVTAAMTLFGQRPDGLVLAFTQTYYRGFSELTAACANVDCGGHYLCSVAAKGHLGFVGTFRLGRRRGAWIACNRQLLVANAFEELLAERAPGAHRWVRRRYDRVGGRVRRHKRHLARPWLSDLIFAGMKPLEWGFLVALYACDPEPETRIACQYI